MSLREADAQPLFLDEAVAKESHLGFPLSSADVCVSSPRYFRQTPLQPLLKGQGRQERIRIFDKFHFCHARLPPKNLGLPLTENFDPFARPRQNTEASIVCGQAPIDRLPKSLKAKTSNVRVAESGLTKLQRGAEQRQFVIHEEGCFVRRYHISVTALSVGIVIPG